jgi:macrodomain Ter protein organizer (MatP/YcbG family)
MKKAWSQKKFREKSSGKKPYSISMTLNTKQKLNALAEEKGMKINDMVEYLVKNEYQKRNFNE